MIKNLKLTKGQWELLAKALSTISQGIILFSLAALFVPETVTLPKEFSKIIATLFLCGGLTLLVGGVMIIKKGK